MKKFRILLMTVMLLTLFATTALADAGGVNDSALKQQLAVVRSATGRYQNVANALADGFVPTETCTFAPGIGTMGYHYINVQRVMDPAINLAEPEVLLYVPSSKGLRLVAVEYFYVIGAPDAPVPNPAPPAPVLFGRPFDGPMLGHEPGMPPHYDLHVWLWKDNPEGLFAPYNPSVSCQ